jgi:tetratricopeptide (TPR) repeat protein
VSVQLVNAADGYHVWSENYDRDVKDVFAVQEEIARSIAGRLKAGLGLAAGGTAVPGSTEYPEAARGLASAFDRLEMLVKRGTADPEAYNLYLKGRYFWNRRSQESSRRAMSYFEEAIARDPGYALAYAGLADSCQGRARGEMARAKNAATRAVALDDHLAEGHAALARALFHYDWDWEGAEREFRRAIDLNPGYPETYHGYSHYLLPAGRVEESLKASRRALDLDPLSVSMVAHVGWHYVLCGNYDEALPYSRAAIDMDPGFFAARIHLGMALEQLGRLEEAIEEFRKAGEISAESSEASGSLGHAFAAAGRLAEARGVLEEMEERARTQFVSPFDRAIVHAGLSDREAALEWLESAAEERVPEIMALKVDPRLANLAGEPRFTALARRIGLPE